MLKLEKTSSSLILHFREKDRFLDSQLLKALAIALFLHGGALILFHISPLIFSSSFIFPPIHVQSDQPLELKTLSVMTAYHEEDEAPPLSFIPPLDLIHFSVNTNLASFSLPSLDAFQALEEHIWPIWHAPVSFPIQVPFIRLFISGDLSKLPLIKKDPLLDQMQSFAPNTSSLEVVYQIQIQERTGEVFWQERLQSSGSTTIDKLTEKILFNLKFAVDGTLDSITGIITFVVSPSVISHAEKDSY